MKTKTVKQVCECKNCGNESEMEFSCSYVDTTEAETSSPGKPEAKKAKGTATCTNCGNEADMWIDL
jgi:transcription elongation factor Elf1